MRLLALYGVKDSYVCSLEHSYTHTRLNWDYYKSRRFRLNMLSGKLTNYIIRLCIPITFGYNITYFDNYISNNYDIFICVNKTALIFPSKNISWSHYIHL